MTLAEFRRLTKDVPDSAVLYVMTPEIAWTPIGHVTLKTEKRLYVSGYDPQKDAHQFSETIIVELTG